MRKGGGKMKIYSVCEYCQNVFAENEIEGVEGIIELKGVCNSCEQELRDCESFGSIYKGEQVNEF
jgi:hypothetical protein